MNLLIIEPVPASGNIDLGQAAEMPLFFNGTSAVLQGFAGTIAPT